MCCVALGSKLYFFGGEYNIDDPCIDEDVKKKYKKVKRDSFPRDVYIFDPDEKVLMLHGEKMNSGKSWPWAFVAKEKIYVIGSNFTTDISDTSTMKNLELKKLAWFEVYEPIDGKWKWTTLTNPPIGNEETRWVGHAVVGTMALLVARQRGKEHLYCFDLDKGQWTERVSHPSQLCNFSGRTKYVKDTFYGCYHNTVAAIAPVADKELKKEEDMGARHSRINLKKMASGQNSCTPHIMLSRPRSQMKVSSMAASLLARKKRVMSSDRSLRVEIEAWWWRSTNDQRIEGGLLESARADELEDNDEEHLGFLEWIFYSERGKAPVPDLASNPLLHRSIAGSRVSAEAAGVDDVTDDKDTGDDISTTARSTLLGKRKVIDDPHPRQHPSESDMRNLRRRYFQQDGLYHSVFAMVRLLDSLGSPSHETCLTSSSHHDMLTQEYKDLQTEVSSLKNAWAIASRTLIEQRQRKEGRLQDLQREHEMTLRLWRMEITRLNKERALYQSLLSRCLFMLRLQDIPNPSEPQPSTSTVPSSSSQPTVPPVSTSSADTSAEMKTLDPKIQLNGSVRDAT
uniref:Uncharacterized protein n=1 Tax=Fagus sylvatica TaxID=28930 RepID=A0A2N9FQF8_FAGSY